MKIASKVYTMWPNLQYSKSIKGDNLIKMHNRVMALRQYVDFVMVYNCGKYDENGYNSIEVWTTYEIFPSP